MPGFSWFLKQTIKAALPRYSKDPRGKTLGFVDGNRVTIPSSMFGGLKLRSEFGTFKRSSLFATQALTAGTFMSYLEEFAVPPGEIVKVQVGVENAHPTATPRMRLLAAFSEVAGDPTQPLNTVTVGGVASSAGSAWVQHSINGNATPSLGALTGSTVNKPFITWFDPYPMTSLPRTDAGRSNQVFKVILEFGAFEPSPSAVAAATTITNQLAGPGISGWEQDTDLNAPPYGNFWRSRSQAVPAGVDPSLLTSTTVDNGTLNYHAPILVRFWLKSGKFLQVTMGPGDSTIEASGDSLDKYGAIYRALHKLQSAILPIAICNIAQAGTSTSAWASMAQVYLPLVPNSLVITPNGSPNTSAPLGNAVRGATVVSAGTGGTPGAATLIGTTGTGTPFQIAATIGAGGAVTALGAVTVPGNYTVLPAVIGNEPVTGGGLTGCALSLSIIGPNNVLALSNIATVKGIADTYGCGVVTVTCLASNTAFKNWLGSDPLRLATNATSLASSEPCIDYAASLAGAVVGNQVQFLAGTTTDGAHPNPTGAAKAEAEQFTPFLKKFIG